MQEYDFEIKYLPVKQNVVSDAISWWPDLQMNSIFFVKTKEELKDQIQQVIQKDTDFQPII